MNAKKYAQESSQLCTLPISTRDNLINTGIQPIIWQVLKFASNLNEQLKYDRHMVYI